MAKYVGVHGGAQKSTAILFDTERPQVWMATGEGLPFHQTEFPHNEIWLRFRQLMQGLQSKLPRSHLDFLQSIDGITIVLPGAFGHTFRDIAQTVFADRTGGIQLHPTILDDTEAVLFSGLGTHGVSVVCGTGAAVYGKSRNGTVVKVDGWGPLLGDDGSAFDIGLKCLRALARGADGRGVFSSTLQDLVEAKLGDNIGCEKFSVYEVVTWVSGLLGAEDRHELRQQIAEIAKLVDAAAMAGDTLAASILHSCADELVSSVKTVLANPNFETDCNVYLEGGVLDGSSEYQKHFRDALLKDYPKLNITRAALDLATGAVIANVCKSLNLSPAELPQDYLIALAPNYQPTPLPTVK